MGLAGGFGRIKKEALGLNTWRVRVFSGGLLNQSTEPIVYDEKGPRGCVV